MVSVDGGEVWADDSGGDGPPLVLLHPGVGDSRFWEPVLSPLTAVYRVVRYDARGFGQSPAPAVKFSLLRDLVTVLDHYRLNRVAIAGCSQGGGTALALAVEQPARVSALVLLCPGIPGFPWPESPAEPDELEAEYERALGSGEVAALADVMQRVWAAAGPTPAVMDQLRSAARAVIASGDLDLRSGLAAGRGRGLPAADRGQPAGSRPDPRMRADRRPRDGPHADPAGTGPGTADDHPDAGARIRLTRGNARLIPSLA